MEAGAGGVQYREREGERRTARWKKKRRRGGKWKRGKMEQRRKENKRWREGKVSKGKIRSEGERGREIRDDTPKIISQRSSKGQGNIISRKSNEFNLAFLAVSCSVSGDFSVGNLLCEGKSEWEERLWRERQREGAVRDAEELRKGERKGKKRMEESCNFLTLFHTS